MAALGIIQTKMAKNELEAYAKAGSIAEEVLTAIRTVVAFGGEKKEAERLESFSRILSQGFFFFLVFSGYQSVVCFSCPDTLKILPQPGKQELFVECQLLLEQDLCGSSFMEVMP